MQTESVAEYTKPYPRPTPESAPFWQACREHVLRLQRCDQCGKFWFPPGNRCRWCWSDRWQWTPVSGRGRLYTFTVIWRAYHPGFANDLPYNVAVVELEEGPRLISNVVGCAPEALAVGMPLVVVFDDVAPDLTLPKFRPA